MNRTTPILFFLVVSCGVTSVEIEPGEATLVTGESRQFSTALKPSDTSLSPEQRSIAWWTEDDKIATVSSSGLVKAVAAGSTRLAVRTTSSPPKTNFAKLTVTNGVPSIPSAYLGVWTSGSSPNVVFYKITASGMYYYYTGTGTHYFISNQSYDSDRNYFYGIIYTNLSTNASTASAYTAPMADPNFGGLRMSNAISGTSVTLSKIGSTAAGFSSSVVSSTNLSTWTTYATTNHDPFQ